MKKNIAIVGGSVLAAVLVCVSYLLLVDLIQTTRLIGEAQTAAVADSIAQVASPDRKVWMLDNNLGALSTNGLPLDGDQIFRRPEQWAGARRELSVYFFIADIINRQAADIFTDEYIRDHMIPVLKKDGVQIGLEVWAPLWAQCTYKYGPNKGKTLGEVRRAEELALMRRIEKLGGEVTYVNMLSVLSKQPPVGAYDNCEVYAKVDHASIQQRMRDIIQYTRFVKSHYPNMKIGELDSLIRFPEWRNGEGYRVAKRWLDDAGIKLDFWVIDLPYETIRGGTGITYNDLVNAQSIIRDELESEFVLVAASNMSKDVPMTSKNADMLAAQSQINLTRFLNELHEAGVWPDKYYNNLYFPAPQYSLPDNNENKHTQMRQVKSIGTWLKTQTLVNSLLYRGVPIADVGLTSRWPSMNPAYAKFVYQRVIRYKKTVDDGELHAIVYVPDKSFFITKNNESNKLPAVLLFHGGGHTSGDPITYFSDVAQRIASQGVAVISFQYRIKDYHGSNTTKLESTQDAVSALKWVVQRADLLGIEKNRIAIVGTSAGGQLAIMDVLRAADPSPQTVFDDDGIAGNGIRLLGASVFYPMTKLYGPDIIASPIEHLAKMVEVGTKVSTPIVIHLGSADTSTTINPNALTFCNAINVQGGDCDIDSLEGAAHNYLSTASPYYGDALKQLSADLTRFIGRTVDLGDPAEGPVSSNIVRATERKAWIDYVCSISPFNRSAFCTK